MLNFNDSTLVKLKIKDPEFEANKKIDMEKLKFYNSRYNKDNLSDYILVNKKPRKEKINKK
jgi:hypothetical protein